MAVCHFAFGIKSAKSKLDEVDFIRAINEYARQSTVEQKRDYTPALDSIRTAANYAIETLFELAEAGNKKAAVQICHLLACYVPRFDKICHADPKAFETLAREQTCWPGMMSRLSAIKKRNAELIRALNLGVDCGLNLDGKQWSFETPEVEAALWLRGMMERYQKDALPENVKERRAQIRKINKYLNRPANYRPPALKPIPTTPEREKEYQLAGKSYQLARNLKPLTRQNYKEWFESSWNLFLSRWREDYENRECFSHYWKSDSYFETDAKNPQKKKLKPGARGDIRHAIKKQIQQAFRSIAPKSPPVG